MIITFDKGLFIANSDFDDDCVKTLKSAGFEWNLDKKRVPFGTR